MGLAERPRPCAVEGSVITTHMQHTHAARESREHQARTFQHDQGHDLPNVGGSHPACEGSATLSATTMRRRRHCAVTGQGATRFLTGHKRWTARWTEEETPVRAQSEAAEGRLALTEHDSLVVHAERCDYRSPELFLLEGIEVRRGCLDRKLQRDGLSCIVAVVAEPAHTHRPLSATRSSCSCKGPNVLNEMMAVC